MLDHQQHSHSLYRVYCTHLQSNDNAVLSDKDGRECGEPQVSQM